VNLLHNTEPAPFTSPRLRGEVGLRESAIRVRGALRESEFAKSPPHPGPLPAHREREKQLQPRVILAA
jgi:hypothetical protein